jgi:ectoine hydroxylase-related dioxygenase (phytanoyl-CoA dioxygenase family)
VAGRAALAADDARRLAMVIEALVQEGVPPLFVYAFDATWALGSRLAHAIEAALGNRYVLLADAWAFRVEPGPDNAGWAPHRGSYVLSRERAAPDHLNVWVALTDATVDNACMHVVPLDEDPAYPDDLRSHAAAVHARPLPIPAGAALIWDANVLHSGGRSSARALGPRISVTFTLRRADLAVTPKATPTLASPPPDHRPRLDLLATQIAVYGDLDRTLPDVVRRWANLTLNLRKGVPFGPSGRPRKAP